MLETKTKKSAEGIFSRRAAVNAERDIRNGGRMGKKDTGHWILDPGYWTLGTPENRWA